ncbi:MAG: hypothetical protein C0403_06880 [Desulfobacterium sp.]|nr:hypothetical protein [Desulfobacterium sp.]
MEKTVYITGCFYRKQSGQEVIIHFNPAILFFSLRDLIHEFERRSLKIIHGAELHTGHKIGLNEITIHL